MRIVVAEIPESGMTLEEREPPEIMGASLDQVKYEQPIHATVSVNLVGDMLIVRGRLVTAAELECNRCLRRFKYGVDVKDYNYSTEVRSDDTIDLTESLRESIILSLPMKRLCSPDCKGLCPACGQDLNVSRCDCSRSKSPGPFSELDNLELSKD